MFDPRNKGQPKLVYSRVPQNEAPKTDQQPLPTSSNFQTPLSKSNSLQAYLPHANSSLGSSTKDERQRQMSMFNDMQKDIEQMISNQQSTQFQRQQQKQQQHGEMRQNSQQHQLNVTVVDVVSTKKQQQHQQPTKGTELYKIPMQDTEGKNAQTGNSKLESYGDMKEYRNKQYEPGSAKRLVNDKLQTSLSSSPSSGMAADNEKKFSASTSGIRTGSLKGVGSINDSNNAILLRHPRIHSDSSTAPNRSPMSPQSPNQYLSPQQFIYYQQHQSPKQQQQQHQQQQQDIHKDVPSQHQDRRPRPEVVRVRSYSAGRQPMPTNSHSASFKSANPGQTWSIPRVSTTTRPHSLNVSATKHDDSGSRSPTATRPHSLNVASTRHDDSGPRSPTATRPHSLNVPSTRHDDSGPRSPSAHQDFSTYNPSASPRALRSQGKPHNEVILRQRSSSPTSSINSSSSQPKSILKPSANQEQPDVFFSYRPLLLPRAHSEKGNTHVPRDFDFGTILTTNKDIFPTRIPTIQVSSQTTDQTIPSNSRQPLQRPLSANAGLANFDLKPEGRPIRKSVTFNSLVQLLQEDRVSTVRCVDA